jgi:hypothetical protein
VLTCACRDFIEIMSMPLVFYARAHAQKLPARKSQNSPAFELRDPTTTQGIRAHEKVALAG